ncbi:hypothetical protein [Kiloniella sp.]|uniref:hypothetical protein n=1 Tax=Kiloniella sp. TaxID=1938587 RepID=UPI003B021DB3
MSILLVVGFGVVIYTISTRVSDGTLTESSENASKKAIVEDVNLSGLPDTFENVTLNLPFGCRLADAQLQSGIVMLRFDGAIERGCQKVELYSSESGERLGGWSLKASGDNPEEPKSE